MTTKTNSNSQSFLSHNVRGIALAVLVLLTASRQLGAQTTFTDQSAFLNALPGGSTTTVANWESNAAGDTIPSGSAVAGGTLTYAFVDLQGLSLDCEVFDFFSTTTPDHYLGVESANPQWGLFLPGDSLTLTFQTPVQAVGVQFVSTAGTLEGVYHLRTTLTSAPDTVADSGPATDILADGSEPYFVGILAGPGDSITAVNIFSEEDLFAYNLDELIVASGGGSACTPGDVTGEGSVNTGDIAPFVQVLLDPNSASEAARCSADTTEDTRVDGGDIASFVALVLP